MKKTSEEINHIDRLITDCTELLVSEDFDKAAKEVRILAAEFAKGGMPVQAFMDTRKYIVTMAEQEALTQLEDKLKQAEKTLSTKLKQH